MTLLKTDLHDEICRRVKKGIGVWDDEGLRLAYLASQVPENGVIVEIGSYRGRSAVFMGAAVKTGVQIFCVDVWRNPKEKKFTAESADLKIFMETIGMFGFDRFTIPIQGSSPVVARDWHKPIDFLFIDGEHTYDAVKKDYESWYPHVKDGGAIAFHDYQPKNWPSVRQFVDGRKELEFTGLQGFIWSGQK